MRLQCPKCRAVYKIDGSKIPEKGVQARCPKCQSRFVLRKKSKTQNDIKRQKEKPENKKKQVPKKQKKNCDRCEREIGIYEITHYHDFRVICDDCHKKLKSFSKGLLDMTDDETARKSPLDFSLDQDFIADIPAALSTPTLASKMSPLNKVLIVFCCIGIATWGVFSLIVSHKKQVKSHESAIAQGERYLHEAYDIAKKNIKLRLRVLSKVKWPDSSESKRHTEYMGNKRYRVDSWYDMEIGPEKTYRQKYVCVISRSGNEWIIESLEFY